MIPVNKINIINEDDRKILYIQAQSGTYMEYISVTLADKISKIIDDKARVNNPIHRSQSECLLKKDSVFLNDAEFQKTSQGTWEELLPKAIELDIPIKIASTLLLSDYAYGDFQHKLFVDQLIMEEKKVDECKNVKVMLKALNEAIQDERFEEAASLRDKLAMSRV